MSSTAGTLPEPVERYLRRAMGGETRRIATARLVQRGTLRMDHTARWTPFEARETVHPGDIAFEWSARLPFANFLHIGVRDAYRHGKAEARVRLQSLLTIGHEKNNEQGDRAALYRFLAEAPWYPSVLFPSERLQWEAIDDWRARATLADGRHRVALEFRFDTFGDVAAIYAPERPRRIRGAYAMAPWEGRFHDYREQQGLCIPMRGEVGWHEGDRWDSVWRGNIVEVHYEF